MAFTVIGTISGTQIEYGPLVKFNPTRTEDISVTALNSTKYVIAYNDWNNYQQGTAIVGEVSGNSSTFGSEYTYNTNSNASIHNKTENTDISALTSSKFVIVLENRHGTGVNSHIDIRLVVGDVAGKNISFGPEEQILTWGSYMSIEALNSTHFILAYRQHQGKTMVGSVNGNIISTGSEYQFFNAWTRPSISRLSDTKFVVSYEDSLKFGYISGTDVTYSDEYKYNSASTFFNDVVSLTSRKFVVLYRDEDNSDAGTARIGYGTPSSVLPLGIAGTDGDNEEEIPVILYGLSIVHTGLVIGEIYYVDDGGTLTTEVTPIRVGLAISETEILLDAPFY
jgi:hypothetical protein